MACGDGIGESGARHLEGSGCFRRFGEGGFTSAYLISRDFQFAWASASAFLFLVEGIYTRMRIYVVYVD